MYWKELMHQCVEIGIGALPIVIIISIFLGAVTTVQTAYQLVSPLVPSSTIAQIVRDSMILELSPTVLSIVLAGVIGSKIAPPICPFPMIVIFIYFPSIAYFLKF